MKPSSAVRKPRIVNPVVDLIHSTFNELRRSSSGFFRSSDQTLIRFSFSDLPEFFQVRVKFSETHKVLKFIVNKATPTEVECAQLEKTRDIVRDIDEIYQLRDRKYYSLEDPEMQEKLKLLFLWGIEAQQTPKKAKKEIFKVKAIKLVREGEQQQMREDCLYYAVLTYHKVAAQNIDGTAIVDLSLLGLGTRRVVCNEAQLDALYPNRILLMNWLGRFNVLSLASTRHHVNFKESELDEITRFITANSKHHKLQSMKEAVDVQ